jgi:hypothetical protein
MYRKIMDMLPPMLAGDELMGSLRVIPKYDENIINASVPERLMAMADLYNIYEPSTMSVEIYSKLYLGLIRSLQKKDTRLSILQQIENKKAILGADYNSIMGGVDSFTVIGESGIGKSRAISRAISLMHGEQIIIIEQPYLKILPVCCIQCPFDSSVKSMLLEILRKVDESLGSNYHNNALRGRMTTDMLIGSVSQVCLNHVGILVVDEIQNIVNSRNGRNLVGALTQLINNSGISICMVGTPASTTFFESEMYIARRSLGLQFGTMKYDDEFRKLSRILLSYRYVGKPVIASEGMLRWLHEHSGGNISALVSLIHDAQENAIVNGTEQLDMAALNEAYNRNLSFLHNHINVGNPAILSKPRRQDATILEKKKPAPKTISIEETVRRAKAGGTDAIRKIKEVITVEEVRV